MMKFGWEIGAQMKIQLCELINLLPFFFYVCYGLGIPPSTAPSTTPGQSPSIQQSEPTHQLHGGDDKVEIQSIDPQLTNHVSQEQHTQDLEWILFIFGNKPWPRPLKALSQAQALLYGLA